jgi:hypothetical protein
MYWSANVVRCTALPSWGQGRAKLTINLEHCMPWFDHYEARVDGGDWERREESFDWVMQEGVNLLECRAVNVQGRAGPVSRLEVGFATPK